MLFCWSTRRNTWQTIYPVPHFILIRPLSRRVRPSATHSKDTSYRHQFTISVIHQLQIATGSPLRLPCTSSNLPSKLLRPHTRRWSHLILHSPPNVPIPSSRLRSPCISHLLTLWARISGANNLIGEEVRYVIQDSIYPFLWLCHGMWIVFAGSSA